MAILFNKVCKGCKREFITEVRHQKYCCPECGKKYQERLKKNRRFADENKQLVRMKSRCHALAVEIKTYDDHMKGVSPICVCGCGSTENLELHHKNLNFCDNTPSNLEWRCTKSHAVEHARIEKEGKAYDQSFYELFKPVIDKRK